MSNFNFNRVLLTFRTQSYTKEKLTNSIEMLRKVVMSCYRSGIENLKLSDEVPEILS
jgi:hypothetical protein